MQNMNWLNITELYVNQILNLNSNPSTCEGGGGGGG